MFFFFFVIQKVNTWVKNLIFE